MKIMPFDILHLDPLGQGVSKVDQKVSFIPKTLPGEGGEMIIVEENSKVSFAKVKKLTKKSEHRVTPSCSHFNECGGCDYLHTNYQNEIEFKKQAIQWLSKKIVDCPSPIIHEAPSRDGYRNRAQFHYDLEEQKIGLKVKKSHELLEISDCLLLKPDMREQYKKIDIQKISKIKDIRPRGHFEISQNFQGPIKINFNLRYAEEGFTQVNEPMNEKLKDLVKSKVAELSDPHTVIYDLFGGGGNLSKELQNYSVHVVDSYPPKNPQFGQHQQFIRCDLFKKPELRKLEKLPQPEVILVDPPRSGFKELTELALKFRPKLIIYVACEPAPLFRDIVGLLPHYQFQELHLLDLFPSTRHFETMAIFTRK